MHFSDFEPNLAEKDVPDSIVVPKICKMVFTWGPGLKIGRKVNIWTIFFAIVQTFARSWQGCHRRTKGTQVCEEESNFRQKKRREEPSRHLSVPNWCRWDERVLTGGSCVLLEGTASLARPLLARQLISGSGAEDLLRSEGVRGEQGAGLVETRRDSSRAKSGHTRSRPTETFRHLHGRQRGGITA